MSPKFEDEIAEHLSIRRSFSPNVEPTCPTLCIALEQSFTLLLKGGSPSAFRSEKINAFSVHRIFHYRFLAILKEGKITHCTSKLIKEKWRI